MDHFSSLILVWNFDSRAKRAKIFAYFLLDTLIEDIILEMINHPKLH